MLKGSAHDSFVKMYKEKNVDLIKGGTFILNKGRYVSFGENYRFHYNHYQQDGAKAQMKKEGDD